MVRLALEYWHLSEAAVPGHPGVDLGVRGGPMGGQSLLFNPHTITYGFFFIRRAARNPRGLL